MSRHLLVPLIALAALAACADRDLPTTPPVTQPTETSTGVTNARERLAARLAVALADPTTRREVVERLAASTAPEGKLQFQALMRADGSRPVGGGASPTCSPTSTPPAASSCTSPSRTIARRGRATRTSSSARSGRTARRRSPSTPPGRAVSCTRIVHRRCR